MTKKIITFVVLCALIVVLALVSKNIADTGISMISDADSHNASTSLLLAQAKQKVISEKAIINNDKSGYIGEKLKDSTNPIIEEFKKLEVIKEDDVNYDSYFIWNQQILDDLDVNVKLGKDEYYIVNYETNEVITTKGVKIKENDKLYYKLSFSLILTPLVVITKQMK